MMRSLFSRIFLSFWLVMSLIVLSAVALTATIAWERVSHLRALQPQQMVEDARSALKLQGEPGLRRWLAEAVKSDSDLDLYIFGKDNADLLGRSVPEKLRHWAHFPDHPQDMDHDHEGPSPQKAPPFDAAHAHGRPLAVASLIGSDGRPYRLVMGWAGASPMDILGSGTVLAGLGLLAIGFSAAVCGWMAGTLSRPIAQLQASARNLAIGDMETRVSTHLSSRHDEIGSLAREFNEMADRLKSQMESKETLLRDISHELRSPLTRLRVATALARDGKGDLDAQLSRIERDIERLDDLIGRTLQFSQISSLGYPLTPVSTDLGALLSDIIQDAMIEAAPNQIDLALAPPPSIEALCGPDLLRRAIDNVLRNAIRFSPPGGRIDVALDQAGPLVRVTVSDQGPGVPDGGLERIFEAFYRAESARDRSSGGAGLGLALTARIRVLHGGRAYAENRKAGGLKVVLEWPSRAPFTPSPFDQGAQASD